ncbi:hypothetical protein CspeluHIS016_0114180 [Cutaneotrichosporon spelunceum]|uniref:NAD(P)-binding protein n=1 Tax=Cutaneotrichosporon spelunceum TaxID=1672016 RepID=A0AAD3YAG3_9TREE|nr:hypothetical protein CspeluHIS016_0114180 [Cutaneotrichosporon spelunceum]
MVSGMNGVGLVTGAASGIGLATAAALLDAGVRRLLLADVNDGALLAARADLHQTYPDAEFELFTVDVTVEAQVQAMVRRAVERFGRIDYCLNSAGVGSAGKSVGETSLEAYNHTVSINQTGTFLCLKYELAQMDRQEPLHPGARAQRGAIVNIASVLGLKGLATAVSYCTSKHAIVGMTKVAAIDYTGKKIRVNAIAPGWIETAMTAPPEIAALVEMETRPERCPAARPGQANEIADVIVFMLSEKASYVNGTTWTADGGLLTH